MKNPRCPHRDTTGIYNYVTCYYTLAYTNNVLIDKIFTQQLDIYIHYIKYFVLILLLYFDNQ